MSYGANVYIARGDAPQHPRELPGEPAWSRIMRAYHMRYRFRHPAKADFLAVVNESRART